MNYTSRSVRTSEGARFLSTVLAVIVFAAPLRAQQPAPSLPPQATATAAEPTFDTLLSADSYKVYGEVRNVGQLLTTGGAGEIVEPIIKLANPGAEFKSLLKFLKDNSEQLATSRLMVANWPTRTDIPTMFAALEFASPEEAAKFTPKLETFLPTVIPPVPVVEEPTETPTPSTNQTAHAETRTGAVPPTRPAANPHPPAAKPAASPEMRSPFVIAHAGSLVFISDKTFKFEKLHPKDSALLSEDHNFRLARDRFSSEPVFVYFNVALEDKTVPKPSPTPVISDEERERIRKEQEAAIQKRLEEEAKVRQADERNEGGVAVLRGEPIRVEIAPASPTPTPTKQQQAHANASNQLGSMFGILGQGQPQWPDAVGVALALDNDEYVVRTILIEPQSNKQSLLPFVPEVIAGPAINSDAASVLPDDTEVLVTTSIDFTQTFQEMKKQAQVASHAQVGRPRSERYENGILVEQGPIRTSAPPDAFAEFEKKAGFKITDDLLPILGNEIAVATSIKELNGLGMFRMPAPPPPKPSPYDAASGEAPPPSLPIFLIAVKDREAAKRLMPRVLTGLGIGEANLLAQSQHRGDSDIVDYAGFFAYAFVGNFLVVSDSPTVQRVADAANNHQTLSSNNAFRTTRHWQPKATLGEVYVSPALMESFQETLKKQAGTMDAAMRDFLLQLSPASSAITYALSHDGLGAVHEVHLPKNLILAMVASTSAAMKSMQPGSPEMNEIIAMSALQMMANAEAQYRADQGSYGSLESLVSSKLITRDILDKYGYGFSVTTSGSGFEVVATPSEYGKSGKRSFFIDQSAVLRGDDHGGGPATIADKPVQH